MYTKDVHVLDLISIVRVFRMLAFYISVELFNK